MADAQIGQEGLVESIQSKSKYVKNELAKANTSKVIASLFSLAALYAVNNNLTFVILEKVDPGALSILHNLHLVVERLSG